MQALLARERKAEPHIVPEDRTQRAFSAWQFGFQVALERHKGPELGPREPVPAQPGGKVVLSAPERGLSPANAQPHWHQLHTQLQLCPAHS